MLHWIFMEFDQLSEHQYSLNCKRVSQQTGLRRLFLYLLMNNSSKAWKGLSTTHYLASLLDTVYRLLDEPGTWLNLPFIDLQKDLNQFSHDVLIEKLLSEFTVSLFLVNIIASFLSNRSQFVNNENHSLFLREFCRARS